VISEHRNLIAATALALTILGFFSGLKYAEWESQRNIAENKTKNVRMPEQIVEDMLSKEKVLETEDGYFSTTTKPVQNNETKNNLPVNAISAEAYIVGNLRTGKIIMEKNPDRVLPVASMSKLVTALVATRIYSSSTQILVTRDVTAVPPDVSGIKEGEKYTLHELLHPLLMSSSNIAGEAIASSSDRTEFLGLMSEYAWEIGMPSSYIADPTGLSENNSATARGFFGLARYILREEPEIMKITTIPSIKLASTTGHGEKNIPNIHPFVNDKLFLGGKTGRTNAAMDTMLTVLDIKGEPIGIVVLRSRDRMRDTSWLVEELTQTSF